MATIRELLARLQSTEVVEPRGWFRWLHNHFAGRYNWGDDRLNSELGEQGWDELAENLSLLSDNELPALISVVNRHAWSIGRLRLTELAERCWDSLSALDRGAFVAGLTERRLEPEEVAWMHERLPACAFSPESACELACNAIRKKWPEVFMAVLQSGADLSASIRRGDDGKYPETKWPDTLAQLSHRVIDMILEAALVQNDVDAVGAALKAGADPNIPIWRLERSYNEKHCALSFAISERRREMAEMLFAAGALGRGVDFSTPNFSLYLAIQYRWDDIADRLLQLGASLGARTASDDDATASKADGFKPVGSRPSQWKFFGHSNEELEWARTAIGSLIPLAPIDEKQTFYQGDGQGGQWETMLDAVVGDVERLRRYESLGLDTRLTVEEFCSAVDWDAFDGLLYLLEKYGSGVRDRVLFRIRRRKLEFGAVRRQLDVQAQDDRINNADGFEPINQPPLALPGGTKLYVDLSAIAPPGHTHGLCSAGHFWLRVEKAAWRRRQDRVVMTKLRSHWEMAKLPDNRYQVKAFLPCIKEVNGIRTRLGVTIDNLFCRMSPEDERMNVIYAWFDTPEFQGVIAEATARIHAQNASNSRFKAPALSEGELAGYPEVFWPYLIRLESGYIGMTSRSCEDRTEMLDIYAIWARQNKSETTFLPDPRLFAWEGWADVPLEFQPFFEIDPVLGTPSVRDRGDNDYECAMIHKAVMWWNAWMTPRILAEIERHQREAGGE